MNTQRRLITLSLLLFVGCRSKDQTMRSAEDRSSEKPPAQACRRIVPPVEEVVFIDAETVLVFPGYLKGIADEEVVNEDRVPLITRDGGESWSTTAPGPLEFDSICFADVALGWLVKDGSELWKTTDGGVSWIFVSKIADDEESLDYSQQAKFMDELNGWILGLDSLWRTQDGGQTWSTHWFPSLVAGFLVRGESVWVVSQYRPEQNNAIYETRDAGTNWIETGIPNTAPSLFDSVDIRDLVFADELTGWLADSRGVYRTDDGGKNWKKRRLPRSRIQIESICPVDAQGCWAAGMREMNASENEFDAILLHTTDGGGSWRQVDVGVTQASFDKVFFLDAQNGWLVSKERAEGEDSIVQNANIYRTRDGGITWKQVLSVKSPYPG